MKNKKGAKQQKFIQQIQKQVANKGQQPGGRDDAAAEREKKRLEEQKKKEELSMLFKPVVAQQTVAKGISISLNEFLKNEKLTKILLV